MNNKNYKIGLDIGSNSVGWCVTDENYDIVEKKNKKLWGVLMFDEQQKNVDRRTNRGARRRIERKRNRIIYLQEIFKNEINKVDPTFFGRLDESFKQDEDRKYHDKYTLFIDKNFNDKTYFKKYPTIYHLQKYLMESNKKEDIRLIYLAIANCIKDRGNFLNSQEPEKFNVSFDKESAKANILDAINELSNYLTDDDNLLFDYSNENILADNFDKILKDNYEKTVNDKLNLYKDIFVEDIKNNKHFKKSLYEFVLKALSGKTISFKDYFINNLEDESTKLDYKISEEQEPQIIKIMSEFKDPDYLINAINKLSEIYQGLLLENIFKGSIKSLPEALVNRFNNYKQDLKDLKRLVSALPNGYEMYKKIFIDSSEIIDNKPAIPNNYVHYTSSYREYNENGKISHKKTNTSKCSRDDFIDYLNKQFGFKDEKDRAKNPELYDLVHKPSFLLKPKTHENSVFPYQLKYQVIKTIIDNQKKFYDFFNEKDDDGYINEDKILSILTFRIPYYYGPLTINNKYVKGDEENVASKWAWLVKEEGKEQVKIRPWNYMDVVDDGTTQNNFIKKMQSRCTYLKNEFTLPKDSIIFQKYLVYQFLNYVRINGNFYFNADEKDKIIENLFLKNRKVSKKQFIQYINTNILKVNKDAESDIAFKNGALSEDIPSLSSLYDFKKVYGSLDEINKHEKEIEEIIKDIAILQDKDSLSTRLKNKYHLNDSQIKIIKGFNYKNFSSLSMRLLNEIEPCNKDGEIIHKTILTLLKECNSKDSQAQSLMGLLTMSPDSLAYEYDFKTIIDKENGNDTSDDLNKFVDELYVPVCSKRAIKQSCKIIEEIQKILKLDNFDNVSFAVEVTRENQKDKKQKDSRYKEMKTILNKIKGFKDNYSEVSNNFNDLEGKDEGKVRSEKYYYYFMQLGKDIYTGDSIDYDKLSDYDIDHIIPQSLIKNDSIDNKVLTKKEFNEGTKKNIYPFFNKIKLFKGNNNEAKKFWKTLLDNKLISSKKYNALTRTVELSDEELEDFENRQKTTTDQSVKGFMSVLKDWYKVPDKNIIYSKAGNVSYFRNKYEIYKSRNINNYHHAHDAYLNIVIGNIVANSYKNTYIRFKASHGESFQDYLIRNAYSINPEKIIDNYFDNKQKDLLVKIKENIFLTKNIFTKKRTTYVGSANVLSGVTLYPANGENSGIPIKNGLATSKYGHYDSYNFPSYCLLKSKIKEEEYCLEAVPAMYIGNNEKYFNKNPKYKDYEIYIEDLKVNTKMKIGDKSFIITGKTNDSYVILNSVEKAFVLEDINKTQNILKTIHNCEKLIRYFSNVIIKINDKSTKLLSSIDYINNDVDSLKVINDCFNGNYVLTNEYIKNPEYDKKDESKNNHELCLKNDELDELYDYILNLYERSCYKAYNSVYSIIKNLKLKKVFYNLNIVYKIRVISELLNAFKTNERKFVNLKFIECSKTQSGVLKQGKNIIIKNGESVKIIYESITGFYKKVINLK